MIWSYNNPNESTIIIIIIESKTESKEKTEAKSE